MHLERRCLPASEEAASVNIVTLRTDGHCVDEDDAVQTHALFRGTTFTDSFSSCLHLRFPYLQFLCFLLISLLPSFLCSFSLLFSSFACSPIDFPLFSYFFCSFSLHLSLVRHFIFIEPHLYLFSQSLLQITLSFPCFLPSTFFFSDAPFCLRYFFILLHLISLYFLSFYSFHNLLYVAATFISLSKLLKGNFPQVVYVMEAARCNS